MRQLPGELQNQPFTLRQASMLGLTFYDIGKLLADGTLEKVSRGVYQVSGTASNEEADFCIAALRVGTPSAVCLISALSFHHLTDTIPKKTWIMVPFSKRSADRSLRVFRARNPSWKVGIDKRAGYSITNIERTVVECLALRSRIGATIAIEALRRAIDSKKTNLGKVADMAKKLKLLHRILPYIEALS